MMKIHSNICSENSLLLIHLYFMSFLFGLQVLMICSRKIFHKILDWNEENPQQHMQEKFYAADIFHTLQFTSFTFAAG